MISRIKKKLLNGKFKEKSNPWNIWVETSFHFLFIFFQLLKKLFSKKKFQKKLEDFKMFEIGD